MARFAARSWSPALVLVGAAALVLDGRLSGRAGTPLGLDVVLALATCLPLAFLDRAPLASVLAFEAGLAVCAVAFHPYAAAVGMLTVVLFIATMRGDRRRSLIVGVATALILTITVAIVETDGHALDGGVVSKVLLVLGAIILGDTVRSRQALRGARQERTARERREREEQARQRLARERLRIARELHDTLAHALVGINVRAGVAAHLGGRHGDDAAALADIKQVSAGALRDLRATLDLLRDRDGEALRGPAHGLDALPALIDGVRSAGLEAHAEVATNGSPVSTTVGQAVFRIVQESLTNVLRHAGAARADVTVIAASQTLAVQIDDNGAGASGAGAPAGAQGHGLRGMSERVQALGGTLTAGPLEPSGWRVRAELPLSGGTE